MEFEAWMMFRSLKIFWMMVFTFSLRVDLPVLPHVYKIDTFTQFSALTMQPALILQDEGQLMLL